MDLIEVGHLSGTVYGLEQMMEATSNDFIDVVRSWMEVPQVLLLIELAKRAPDTKEFFPHGKWATIQAIQERVSTELDKYRKES